MGRSKRHARLVAAKELLDAAGIVAAIDSMATRILEDGPDPDRLIVVGVRTGGAHLAARLARALGAKLGREVPVGVLDITLYRDDLFVGLPRPEIGPTSLPASLDGRETILVDDVLYTGRTIRAALEELIEYGRPRYVRLAVLVDRGNRELPIQADCAGLTIATTRRQTVQVHLAEEGETDRVVLYDEAP